MARKFHNGLEQRRIVYTATGNEIGLNTGLPTINTAIPHGGVACLECASASPSNSGYWVMAGVDSRTYYLRMYFRKSGTPSAQSRVMRGFRAATTSVQIFTVELKTDNTLILLNSGGTQVGSASAALSDNVWYRIEVRYKTVAAGATGALELTLATGEGTATSVASTATNAATGVLDQVYFGQDTPGITRYYDDIAINDDQGSDQNSWCGPGVIRHCNPVSDNAVGTGWTQPKTTGDDVTDIFESVNNFPPAGIAHSDLDANQLKYIFNIASNAATNYDTNLESFTAAGVPNDCVVKIAQAIVRGGSNSATDTAIAVDAVSNPDQGAETSIAAVDNGIAGVDNATPPDAATNTWQTRYGTLMYNPTVVRATQPVLRVGKRTATTRAVMIDSMALLVEYEPVHRLAVTEATELDTSVALDYELLAGAPTEVDLIPALEAGVAQVLSHQKAVALINAGETDAAQSLLRYKTKLLTAATETDAGQVLGLSMRPVLVPALETDAAQVLGWVKHATLTPALETDEAQSLVITHPVFVSIVPAVETDAAQAITFIKPLHFTLLPAVETGAAAALDVEKPIIKSLTFAPETDLARALSYKKPLRVTLVAASEADAAHALTFIHTHYRDIVPALEADYATPFVYTGLDERQVVVRVDRGRLKITTRM